MKILVTGGVGFVGSHLCDLLLSQGHRVTAMDDLSTSTLQNIAHLERNPNFDFWRRDVCDTWHFDCDRIFHLACPASPVQYSRNPVRTIRTCVQGTINALECARNTGARLLFTSTSEVYGDPLVHPQQEGYFGNVDPIGSRSCYDEGKRCAEALCVAWQKQHGTKIRIARIFNTYGPRMDLHDGRLIPELVRCMIDDEKAVLFGGSQTRSWCYVSDTVRGLDALMSSDVEGPVNIGNPEELTIEEVAVQIKRFGKLEWDFKPSVPGDPKMRRPDITRARELLGWEPMVTFATGIERSVRSLLK